LAAYGLKRGDVGTVVLVHGDNEAFEVEFVGYDGNTVALVAVERAQVCSLPSAGVPHVRELASA
jgi:hypothetical protein